MVQKVSLWFCRNRRTNEEGWDKITEGHKTTSGCNRYVHYVDCSDDLMGVHVHENSLNFYLLNLCYFLHVHFTSIKLF